MRPADWPACTLPTEAEGSHSCGSSVPGESSRSPAGNGPRATRPEAEETSAAPAPRHPVRPATANSVPPPSAAQDTAARCFCLPCRSRRSASGQGVIQSDAVEFRAFFSWVTDFRARCSPLTSGKHLPGITNPVRSGPNPQTPLHFIWDTVPFDVGTDYAMWAPITVKQQMLPTSERNRCPHRMESPAHIDRNTQPSLASTTTARQETSFEACHAL